MSDFEADLPDHDSGPSPSPSDYGTVRIGAITDEELQDGFEEPVAAPDYETWDPEKGRSGDSAESQVPDGIMGRFSRTDFLVVLVSTNEVEVLAPRGRDSAAAKVAGDSRLVQFTHDLPLGKALAQLIVSTLKDHGVTRNTVRLAFSHEILPAHIIEVPNLASRDLQPVMARRTATLIDAAPEEVAFSALALDGPDAPERRWIVHPMLAKPLIAMQMELRSAGWTVRDAVPARTAPFLSAPIPVDGSQGQATLVIVFDRDAVGIGLVTDGRLVHLSSLPGSLDTHLSDQGARSLVQELRGVDAFWRRSSRGDQVTEILILGAIPSALDILAPSIRAALGDVRVAGAVGSSSIAVPGADWLERAPNESRIDLLRSLRAPRAVNLDLSLPLRPRSRSILAVAMSSLVVCSTVALGMRVGMEGLASSISTEARVVEAASADLEELKARSREVATLESLLLADCSRLSSLEGMGVSATPIVTGLRDSFGDNTRLLTMRAMGLAVGGATVAADRGEVGSLHVRGLVINAPGKTMAALHRLQHALNSVPGMVRVEIEPPSLSDRGPSNQFGAGTESLRFLATARLVPIGTEAAYLAAPLGGVGAVDDDPLPGGE